MYTWEDGGLGRWSILLKITQVTWLGSDKAWIWARSTESRHQTVDYRVWGGLIFLVWCYSRPNMTQTAFAIKINYFICCKKHVTVHSNFCCTVISYIKKQNIILPCECVCVNLLKFNLFKVRSMHVRTSSQNSGFAFVPDCTLTLVILHMSEAALPELGY